MMLSAFATVETSGKIAMSVLAPRDVASLIFQAMRSTHNIYFAASVHRWIDSVTRVRRIRYGDRHPMFRALRCLYDASTANKPTLLRQQSDGARS